MQIQKFGIVNGQIQFRMYHKNLIRIWALRPKFVAIRIYHKNLIRNHKNLIRNGRKITSEIGI